MAEGDELDIGCLVIGPSNATALYYHFLGEGLRDSEARQRILELDSAVEDCAIEEYKISCESGGGVQFLKGLEDSLAIREMTTTRPTVYTQRHKKAHVPSEEPSAFVKYVGTQRDQFAIV